MAPGVGFIGFSGKTMLLDVVIRVIIKGSAMAGQGINVSCRRVT
jgi:tartrate dehydratase alpha subunit/fumarate hydratase class I-like protein